ncbi:MAG: DUF4348 domain-containing protein [Bacteroidaceae bacterium]|nr:DUF4348 domain-containing protein [Bacteroidaceae bacterium]
MKGYILSGIVLCAVLIASCNRGRTDAENADGDSTEWAGELETDSTEIIEEDDEGLSLDNHTTEVFGDFIFAFTHNARFRTERINFPLPVTEANGTERHIKDKKQFREEFRLPGNNYYTLILNNKRQMETLQNDTELETVAMQCLNLHEQSMTSYNFYRTNGRWRLKSIQHSSLPKQLEDFLGFYEKFTTDSVFQQESLAPQLTFAMEDPDEEETDIEGTIDRSQWPVFRPEIPGAKFVHLDFGQTYPNPSRIYLMQCGISNGMLDVFAFRHNGNQWQLVGYEN